MAPKGTAAKCEAAAKAEALEEKKVEKALAKAAAAAAAAAEVAALKKAAAKPALKRTADGRPTKSWYAPTMDTMEAAATQVDHVFGDTQDDTPLTTLAGVASGDDEPLQTPAMNADDTAGEDGQQQSPEQQSPEPDLVPAQEACRPLSPPHHTNLQI